MSVQKKTWDEFREAGLLWWINRTLHLFGWVIVVEVDDEGKVNNVYPARCKYRGFARELEEEGFKDLSKHLKDNIDEIQIKE